MAAVRAPHVEEQRADPRAFAEGQEASQRLSPEHLCELVEAQKYEAERATASLRADWAYWWDLWANRVRYPGKEDWQSTMWVPKPFAAVEQATALTQRSLVDSPEFFGIDGGDAPSKVLAKVLWEPLTKLALGECGFREKFVDGAKVGYILGLAGYWKFRWTMTMVPTLMGASLDGVTGRIVPSFAKTPRSALALDFVLPWNVFRDPDSRPRDPFSGSYIVHSEWKDRALLMRMIDAGWDRDAVEKLLATDGTSSASRTMTNSQQQQAQRRQQSWERHKFRKSYLLDEWYGDVLNEHGDPVMPDAMMTISGRHVLYGPAENPLWAVDVNSGRRKWPLIACSPLVHPDRFEGRGIVEQDAPLSEIFSNTLNLFADAMNWDVNPEREVFQQGLVDWDDLGTYPGKTWIKTVREPVVASVNAGQVDVGAVMAFLQFVNNEREASNFVSSYAVGLPGSRSNITKGEVEIRTGQSLAIIEGMARNLEAGGRACVELAQQMLAQFMPGRLIEQVLGPEKAMLLAQMPLERRVQELSGTYTYTFTGVSQALQKADQLQKLVQFGQLAGSMPYVQMLIQTNPAVFFQLLRAFRDSLGLVDRIDVPEMPAPPPPPPGMPSGGPMTSEMAAAAEANGRAAGSEGNSGTGFINPAVAAGVGG